jgi:hypothetical protein
MHPGPMNRGIEIDSQVADGPYSVILEQVTNGVAARMALLYLLTAQGKEVREERTERAERTERVRDMPAPKRRVASR